MSVAKSEVPPPEATLEARGVSRAAAAVVVVDRPDEGTGAVPRRRTRRVSVQRKSMLVDETAVSLMAVISDRDHHWIVAGGIVPVIAEPGDRIRGAVAGARLR